MSISEVRALEIWNDIGSYENEAGLHHIIDCFKYYLSNPKCSDTEAVFQQIVGRSRQLVAKRSKASFPLWFNQVVFSCSVEIHAAKLRLRFSKDYDDVNLRSNITKLLSSRMPQAYLRIVSNNDIQWNNWFGKDGHERTFLRVLCGRNIPGYFDERVARTTSMLNDYLKQSGDVDNKIDVQKLLLKFVQIYDEEVKGKPKNDYVYKCTSFMCQLILGVASRLTDSINVAKLEMEGKKIESHQSEVLSKLAISESFMSIINATRELVGAGEEKGQLARLATSLKQFNAGLNRVNHMSSASLQEAPATSPKQSLKRSAGISDPECPVMAKKAKYSRMFKLGSE